MTIKVKIILGFIALMLITIIASTIGYNGFTIATENLWNVRRYSVVDTATSEIINDIGSSYRRLVLYMKDGKEDDAKAIEKIIGDTNKHIKVLLDNLSVPARVEKIKKLQADNELYSEHLLAMVSRTREANDTYNNLVRPSSSKCIAALSDLNKFATRYDNLPLLSLSSDALAKFAFLLPSMARYNTSYLASDKDIIVERLDDFAKSIKAIEPSLISEDARKAYQQAAESLKAIQNSLGLMIASVDRLSERYGIFLTLRDNLEEQSGELKEFAVKRSGEVFSEATTSNDSGQSQLFTSSIIGAVIGIILAFFIINSLVRVLKDVSGFAGAIARGDFTYKVVTKEKGEIGQMIAGMQQIPHVLQELIDGTIAGVKKIQVGYFKNRVDAKAYSGAYAELVNAVNTVADTYTEILNEMPVPLLTANKSNKVSYANSASEVTLDGKLLESYITEGESNFGIKAVESGKSYTSESTFIKDNKSRTMAVTAVPLNDYEGTPVAFIEIITDLTEIKEQQRVMLQVAEEATEIATRVAAASEEIAAQVEQVSRGADVQRSRVESTASAMTEMNATVIEVARNASEAAEQSDNTRAKAENGSDLVNSVMQSINQVNTVSQNLHTNMQELGTQAESIGSVMNVISDIADQTNLLALNAAIEAARAGEAGRGFAVVADEVRKLAEKTMQATQEVGSSISAVQQSARINIDEVSKAVVAVEEANQLASSSNEALSEIVELASANSSVVNSIATAAEEQSATSSEISNALDEINTIVGETTEGMVQSSSAIQDLSAMAQDLQRVMSGLR